MASILEIAASPIFSGLTGGLMSVATGVLQFFQKKQDNAHALALADKERERLQLVSNIDAARLAGVLATTREAGAAAAFTASIEAEGRLRGEHKLIASLRASVRPVLVYGYQLAFFISLASALLAWWQQWAPEAELVPLIQYMVVSVINTATMTVSWYFGQRQMDRAGIAWGNATTSASVRPTAPKP
jgi:hypothetical protein